MTMDEPITPVVPELEEADSSYVLARRAGYKNESDPIFFQWQRGEATEQEWLDAVARVKEMYPKPL